MKVLNFTVESEPPGPVVPVFRLTAASAHVCSNVLPSISTPEASVIAIRKFPSSSSSGAGTAVFEPRRSQPVTLPPVVS